MRIGVMIGPERGRGRAKVDRMVAEAEAAERAGFATIWVPQIPGTAVVPIQPRHPIAMAQQALSTQTACDGRFVLGIGVSHHWVIAETLGLPDERPAHQMRSYLEVLSAALAGPGTHPPVRARPRGAGRIAPPHRGAAGLARDRVLRYARGPRRPEGAT